MGSNYVFPKPLPWLQAHIVSHICFDTCMHIHIMLYVLYDLIYYNTTHCILSSIYYILYIIGGLWDLVTRLGSGPESRNYVCVL